MHNEQFTSGTLRDAQIFFWELYREISGGPLESQDATETKMAAIAEQVGLLTLGGTNLENGAVEAAYEAFVKPVQVDVAEGEPVITEQEDVVQTCTLQYAQRGFYTGSGSVPILWSATFSLENRPLTSLFCTPDNRLSQSLGNGNSLFDVEHGREPIVVANYFAGVFHPDIFIQRIY